MTVYNSKRVSEHLLLCCGLEKIGFFGYAVSLGGKFTIMVTKLNPRLCMNIISIPPLLKSGPLIIFYDCLGSQYHKTLYYYYSPYFSTNLQLINSGTFFSSEYNLNATHNLTHVYVRLIRYK